MKRWRLDLIYHPGLWFMDTAWVNGKDCGNGVPAEHARCSIILVGDGYGCRWHEISGDGEGNGLWLSEARYSRIDACGDGER